MAVEAIPDGLENENYAKSQQLKQATEAAGRVETKHHSPPGDVQAGLTTAVFEQKGVRELLKTFRPGTEIPEYYIKPEHMRQQPLSNSKHNTDNQIPVVDLSASHEDLMVAMENACEWGFFQMINHGTSANLLRKFATEAEEFFALPLEAKLRCTTAAKVAGPIHFGGGSKGDWRDVLKVNCAPPSEVAMDHWPLQPVGFKETLVDYACQQQALVRTLFDIIGESLGLEKGYIDTECGDPRVLLAINHYPPCPDPSLTMGIREHSDPCTITVLLQDGVSGLQVYKDGLWLDVKPMENALVVNIGDHLQILTNGRYPSCLHRVVNNKWSPRTSIALFFSPSLTAHIKPAPALIDKEHPALFRDFVYGDYLRDFYRNGGPNKKVILSKFKKPNELTT